jgi:hypothetical protein
MFCKINNDIMLTQVAVDVAGTINVMESGDVMSRQMKNIKYESVI